MVRIALFGLVTLASCSLVADFGGLAGGSGTTVDTASADASSGDGAQSGDAVGPELDGGVGADAGPGLSMDAGTDASLANHAIKTVFVILMTHLAYAEVSSATPYLQSLTAGAARPMEYVAPPGLTSLSLPHVLWLEGASNFGVTNDSDPSANHQSTTIHLVTELEARGVTWRAYQEDTTASACPTTNNATYLVHHNPFVYFDDIGGSTPTAIARCAAHVRPYSELAADLKNGTVAQYNFITPNRCHDMHDDCNYSDGGGDPVGQGDTWLGNELPAILQSSTFTSQGAAFIVWDYKPGNEAAPLPLFVLSPFAKKGYSNTVLYNHSSFVKTISEIFGVVRVRAAALPQTADLADLFTKFP